MEEIEIKYRKPSRTKTISGEIIKLAYQLHGLMKEFEKDFDEMDEFHKDNHKDIKDYVRAIESANQMRIDFQNTMKQL